jgi:6-phosphofructokinase 1
MGRDAGFVVQNAVIASTIVDLALIPEVSFKLEDVFKHVDATIARKNYCVVVVAEGAGQELVATREKDATGHTKYGDIGVFLRDQINAHLKPKGGRSFYIDPSYIIRSIPIRPNDHIYCTRLSNDAVHTAMRGYSGVCVGALNNVISIIPSKFVASGKRRVKLTSSNWQLACACANMPSSLSGLCAFSPPART